MQETIETPKYKYVSECPSGYECSICNEALIDPVVEVNCGNMFCRECINKWIGKPAKLEPLCPQCRACISIETMPAAPNVVKHVLNSLMVTCENCEKPFERENLASHVDICPVPCKHKDQGCVAMVAPKDWDAHDKTCLKKIIKCRAHPVGCRVEGVREYIYKHHVLCPHYILRKELTAAADTTREVAILKDMLKSLQAIFNEELKKDAELVAKPGTTEDAPLTKYDIDTMLERVKNIAN